MITFIGWAAILYVVLKLLGKILIAHKDKDRSWYEEPIFKEKDNKENDLTEFDL